MAPDPGPGNSESSGELGAEPNIPVEGEVDFGTRLGDRTGLKHSQEYRDLPYQKIKQHQQRRCGSLLAEFS